MKFRRLMILSLVASFGLPAWLSVPPSVEAAAPTRNLAIPTAAGDLQCFARCGPAIPLSAVAFSPDAGCWPSAATVKC
jgi:hypothetical protein